MVTYIQSDLEFILKQIQGSETYAVTAPLYGPGGPSTPSDGELIIQRFASSGSPVAEYEYGDHSSGNDGYDVSMPMAAPVVGSPQDDVLIGRSGGDLVFGFAGTDYIIADAGAGRDVTFADDGDDDMFDSPGSDFMDAGDDNDMAFDEAGGGVWGDGGTDALYGADNATTGLGDDAAATSNAINVVDGGADEDIFVFGSTAAAHGDTIRDFEAGDKIDLSEIDASAGATGNNGFTLENDQSTTAPSQLAITYETREEGEYTAASDNTSGNNAPEFQLNLAGDHSLTGSDFIL
jgi:hypothetical protein